MESSINVPFFLIGLIAIVACALVALIVEAIARGEGGKITYVFTFIVALIGAFMAIHWEFFDHRTIGDLVLHGAMGSTIVMGLFISAIGSWLGKALYAVICALICASKPAPIWEREDEEAAIMAVQKETDVNKLDAMARDAASYRVRAIADEKLGRHQAAQYDIALNSPDEAECLAALDKVDWNGHEYLLMLLATTSQKESVALKAVGKIHDEKTLAEVLVKTPSGQVAVDAFSRIGNADVLREALDQMKFGGSKAPFIFEAGKERGDIGICVKALNALVDANASGVAPTLACVEDAEFLKAVVVQWLDTADKPLELSEKLKGQAIVEPAIAKDLEDYFCPDGHLHDLEDTSYIMHAGTDETYGVISCKRCGYEYTVDGHVQRYGENCGYVFRPDNSRKWLMAESKQVTCRPGGGEKGDFTDHNT